MKTKPWAIFLMILCSIFVALALVFLKKASENLIFSIDLIFNYWIYFGILSLIIGAGIMIFAFKGGNVSILYPIMGSTYIWLTLFSILIYGDKVTFINWAGIFLIVIGLGIVCSHAKGGQKNVV